MSRVFARVREGHGGHEKQCPRCSAWYPATSEHFYAQRAAALSLAGWCKACLNVYRKHRRAIARKAATTP